jgi:hypothetical protein
MIIKTETAGPRGGVKRWTETVRHIAEHDVESYRNVAKTSGPVGSIRTIKVVQEA